MIDKYIFTASFADIPIKVTANYRSTMDFCKEYFTDLPPVCEIVITQDDIIATREIYEKQNINIPAYSADRYNMFLETIALHLLVCNILPEYGRALMHCSSIEMNGEAVLFTAPSGTGKSTHSSLWKKVYGDAVSYVNDDKPFVGVKDGKVYVFGSPWQGKHNLGKPVNTPIRGIGIIIRDENNFSVPVNLIKAIQTLLLQMHRPEDKKMMTSTVSIIKAIIENIPVYEIHCNMNEEAAVISHDTFFK